MISASPPLLSMLDLILAFALLSELLVQVLLLFCYLLGYLTASLQSYQLLAAQNQLYALSV
jgi:hypothetical protein